MKKYLVIAFMAALTIGFVASCENETSEETIELYSPDPDKTRPPGCNC